MSYQKVRMFLLSVHIIPQKEGMDVARFLQKLSSMLTHYSTATRVLYKFKVSFHHPKLSHD